MYPSSESFAVFPGKFWAYQKILAVFCGRQRSESAIAICFHFIVYIDFMQVIEEESNILPICVLPRLLHGFHENKLRDLSLTGMVVGCQLFLRRNSLR